MRAWRANHQIASFVAVRAESAKFTRKSPGAARATRRTRTIAAGRGAVPRVAPAITTTGTSTRCIPPRECMTY